MKTLGREIQSIAKKKKKKKMKLKSRDTTETRLKSVLQSKFQNKV